MVHSQTKDLSFSIQQISDTYVFAPCFPDNLKDLLTKFAYSTKPGGPANTMELKISLEN